MASLDSSPPGHHTRGWRGRLLQVAELTAVGALLIPLFALSAGEARAQRIGAGYQAQLWSHDDLRRLHGGVLRSSWANGVGLSLELGGAAWKESGTTCGGFVVDPDACVVEPLDVQARAFAVQLEFVPLELRLLTGIAQFPLSSGLAAAGFDKAGTQTGTGKGDGQAVLEVGIGARYLAPALFERFRLFGEYRLSAGRDLMLGSCLDCYDPMREFATRRIFRLGVMVGR